MINGIESLSPLWIPGTQHGYFSNAYGFSAGELVRRVDPKKRTVGEFVRDEINKELDVELYIGLPSEYIDRVSPIGLQSTPTFNGYLPFTDQNDYRTWQAEIPDINGIRNARSLAKMYACLIGKVKGKKGNRLLNEETLQRAIKSNTPPGEIDFVLNITINFAMGYLLYQDFFPSLGPVIFGYSGNFRHTV